MIPTKNRWDDRWCTIYNNKAHVLILLFTLQTTIHMWIPGCNSQGRYVTICALARDFHFICIIIVQDHHHTNIKLNFRSHNERRRILEVKHSKSLNNTIPVHNLIIKDLLRIFLLRIYTREPQFRCPKTCKWYNWTVLEVFTYLKLVTNAHMKLMKKREHGKNVKDIIVHNAFHGLRDFLGSSCPLLPHYPKPLSVTWILASTKQKKSTSYLHCKFARMSRKTGRQEM